MEEKEEEKKKLLLCIIYTLKYNKNIDLQIDFWISW